MRRPSPLTRLAMLGGALLLTAMAAMQCRPSPEGRGQPQVLAPAAAEAQVHLLVQPGTETEAGDYYQRISGAQYLNFQVTNSTLDTLLSYMGYSTPLSGGGAPFGGLLARDLEQITSFALMPRTTAEFAALKGLVANGAEFDAQLNLTDFENDRVLVSRFFAPKIATYYNPQDPFQPINPDAVVPGWRKLVRLEARKNSRADQAGVQHMYLLFNVKEPDPDKNPFDVESGNNQVILVPRDQDARDSAYFAVYGAKKQGYPISHFLAADFDLPGHVGVSVPGGKDGNYFVPRSCAECHGHAGSGLRGQPIGTDGKPTSDFKTGEYRFAKPNYLDTDQWYDWMEFDFRGVATSLNDVVFDGGKAHGSIEYSRAMDVVRRLNRQIRDQTFAAEPIPITKSFQTLAADKWLELHDTDLQRVPYSARSFGTERWDAASRDEMRLLRLLNNHCFRCHSSLIYNVFDREAIKNRRKTIPSFLTREVLDPQNGKPLPGFRMPQGRVLTLDERDEIIALLAKVFK